MPFKLYVCIRLIAGKYLIHPATEQQYQHDVAAAVNDVWYYETTESVIDFALAGVFGVYDTIDAAKAAIMAVDPGCNNVYDPPSPTNPT